MSAGEHRLALPAGYELGKYRFREILGSGGFGITYLAEDRMLSRQVAVKELLPNDIATRIDGTTVAAKTKEEEESLTWARDRFVNEGRALAACDHPNVVHVYEMIEANGTAYMVTKYEEGRSLERWLRDLGRAPDETELRGILTPLLSGLEKVHAAGFLHRDIKPENIYLTTDGRPVLLDFGSARQAVSNRSMAMTSIVTSGYAPFEQYYEDGNQGPWSDIYAMGAVMYRAIVGKKPPEATRRLKDDPCEKLAAHYSDKYSAEFLRAIDKALIVNETKRPQSVTAWREMFGDAQEAVTLVKPRTVKRQASWLDWMQANPQFAAGGALGLVVIGVAIWYFTRPTPGHNINKPKPPIAVITPTPAPTAAPSPTATPRAIAQVTPTPAPAPTASPYDSLVPPQPSPSAPDLNPSVSATPASTPEVQPGAVVDAKLVGSWQTGSTKSKRVRWDLWADGHWVLTGAVNDSGTLTASEGRIKQFSNNAQQWVDLSYEFNDDLLVTHGPLGTAEWHHLDTDNKSTAKHTPSSRHHDESREEPVGRKILNRFLQSHGF